MSFFTEVPLVDQFEPLEVFQDGLGFIPNLVRAQSLVPRLIEAHATKERAIRLHSSALSRIQKEQILICVAISRQNAYCASVDNKVLRSLGGDDSSQISAEDSALLYFCTKLSSDPTSINSEDVDTLRRHGFDDEAIIEAVATAGLAVYRCTLATGLGPEPEFGPPELAPKRGSAVPASRHHAHPTSEESRRPYVRAPYLSPESFAPFGRFQKTYGFIPKLLRAQTLRPDLITAQVLSAGAVLLPEDVLARSQKESIMVAVSAANLNSYCVAGHCNMLRGLGLPAEEADQIAVDYHHASLPEQDKAMLDFAVKLGARFPEFSRPDILRLQELGFTDQQIVECIAVTALNNFINTLQMGLGVEPDFEPPPLYERNKMLRTAIEDSPVASASPAVAGPDPDIELAAEARAGNLDAFEQLIRRNSRPVYRALVAILGSQDEAQDAMQDVLLSAFKHMGEFQGRSKFSTWLVSIARNAALQRLRERRHDESLDQGVFDENRDFRPRQVRAWQDNPEQQYAKSEILQLVEKGIMGLPGMYRMVVMMRDVEQLSTDEVARQLGLTVPTVKVRLLRGRLMLRESLSPHFAKDAKRVAQ